MADSSLPRSFNTGIYEIRNTVNGKVYVGSASNFHTRWQLHRLHLNRGTHHSRYLQSAWNKYGAESFEFNRLLVCERKNLVMYEQAAMDALHPKYNMAPKAGSCLGVKHTPEACAKQSAAKMGNQHTLGYKHRPESIEKLRLKQLGVPSPTRGKPRSPDAVAATAEAHRGMKRSAETRAKIAAKAKGRKCAPRSAEYLAKLSAAQIGKPKSEAHIAALQAGRKSHVLTEGQRRALSDALKRGWADGTRSRVKSDATKANMSRAFSKLSADEVREMKRLHANGVTGRELSKQFKTPTSTVSHIVRGLRYRWVTDE